jgi:hypothetical protein
MEQASNVKLQEEDEANKEGDCQSNNLGSMSQE